ncbi:MAG: SDR family NAD(P)-dependent oxidoreductase [Chitinophagaceae bacterium]|nr:SDR family NAD(P)-dependent oxidoreductase [Chitinophagaceae bacterium]
MKKAIVIGATSGIGRELALILLNNGYKVGLTGRRIRLLEEIRQTNPAHIEIMQMDITETDLIEDKLNRLRENLGGLDLLVISAGIGELNPSLDFSLEHTAINTNVTGFTCVAGWAFNYFQEKRSGHLAGITSIAGLRGSGIAPSYNATKSYQINYLEGLRQKARKQKLSVTVTDIRPGFVDTVMAKGDGQFWVAPVLIQHNTKVLHNDSSPFLSSSFTGLFCG